MKDVNYRPETFKEFVKTKKLVWPLLILWIAVGILTVIKIVLLLCGITSIHWFIIAFYNLGLITLTLIHYSQSYTTYKKGNQAYNELEALSPTQVYEVSVWVRGFDILTRRKHSPDETRTGIYQYNKADIILGQKSMVLLGKNTYFGGVIHITPVELIVKEKQASIRTAWIKGWTEENNRITISIVDEYYEKPFKIDFKDHVEQIREWLVTIGATRM